MLTQVELNRFKSFKKASFGVGPLTLIVGANASGKSNVRDALRFLHGIGQGYSLAEILGGKYGPGGVQQWRGIRGGPREVVFSGRQTAQLRAWVKVGLATYRYAVTFDISDERTGPRVTYEALWAGGSYLFCSAPEDDPVQQRGEHELRVRQPRGGNYRGHGKVSAFPSHTPVLAQLPHRTKEPARLRHVCSGVLEVFQSMRFLDLDPDAMREPAPPGQTILGDRGENLSSVMQAICQDPERKESLLGWVRSLTPMDAVDFDFKLDLNGRVLLYLEESSGQLISAVSASDGTLRFLALVAALLSPDTGRLYFFEEFDNGIHPTRLHLLLDLVQQACQQQQVQVVGTTHNPALLAFLLPDARQHAVLAYRPDDAPDSRLRRIADLPDIERILQSQDLGRLHAAGWLEDAAAFSEPDQVASAKPPSGSGSKRSSIATAAWSASSC